MGFCSKKTLKQFRDTHQAVKIDMLANEIEFIVAVKTVFIWAF